MQKISGAPLGDRLLRLPEVTQKVGIKKDAIYFRVARGEFPKPIRLGYRAVAWLESEVDQWISNRVSDRDHEHRKTQKLKDFKGA